MSKLINFDPNDPMNKLFSFVMFFFYMLTTLSFLILKLCEVISWSWWWVFIPIWGPLAVSLTVLIILKIVDF